MFMHPPRARAVLACWCVVALLVVPASMQGQHAATGAPLHLSNGPGTTYHVSSSTGDDSNDGLTPGTAWKTFDNLNVHVNVTLLARANDKQGNPALFDNGTEVYTWFEDISNGTTILRPGDRVSLQRGDTWHQPLRLAGKGNATCPIELAAHGTGPKPVIALNGHEWERCIVLDEASWWTVANISMRSAKIGLYLRYWDTYRNEQVTVADCDFRDIASMEWERTWEHNFEFSWSAGIFVGGKVHSEQASPVLHGLTVRGCTFTNCSMGFINNWYWADPAYRSRLTGLLLDNCTATGGQTGFAINAVGGGRVSGFHVLSGGGRYACGTTGGFAQDCRDVIIERCVFANITRDLVPDGVGFDFEGNNRNMTFRRNVLCNNDGAGILVMSTNGRNEDILIQHCLFYNNCRNPSGDNYAFELLCYDGSTTGTLDNIRVFLGTNVNRVTGLQGRTIASEGDEPRSYTVKCMGQVQSDGRTRWRGFRDECQVRCSAIDPAVDYTSLWPIDDCDWCVQEPCPTNPWVLALHVITAGLVLAGAGAVIAWRRVRGGNRA